MSEPNLTIVEQARDEIIKLLADKRHEHSLYMKRCKGITASIKDWKDKAKEAGAPRVSLQRPAQVHQVNDKIDAPDEGYGSGRRGGLRLPDREARRLR